MFDVLSSKRAIKELCNEDETSARKLAGQIVKLMPKIDAAIKTPWE